jgi:RNA polymerase sigma-70 factor (ECF subfamily)
MQFSSNQRQAKGFEVIHNDFEMLYDNHSREVWALAYAHWQNADVALDIMQDTFLRLWRWRLRHESEVIQNPRALVLRVARTAAADYGKSGFRRRWTEILREVPSKEPSSLENMLATEQRETLQQTVKQLPSRYADELLLHFGEQLTRKEIANLRGWTVPAVNNLLTRAIHRLHEVLRDSAAAADDDDLTVAR